MFRFSCFVFRVSFIGLRVSGGAKSSTIDGGCRKGLHSFGNAKSISGGESGRLGVVACCLGALGALLVLLNETNLFYEYVILLR